MGNEKKSLPLILKIHNMTCPFWLSGIEALKKLEPGCQAVAKHLKGEKND